MDPAHRLLQLLQLVCTRHRAQVVDRMAHHLPLQHAHFLGRFGVAEVNAQQESVELRLGQGERAFVLDRILSCENNEGRRERPGDAFDRDLLLLHGFQQR